MGEKRIIDETENGNSEDFKVLYEKYYMKIYNYVRSNGAKDADVDDIVQLSFLKIYKNLKYFDVEKGNVYNFMVSNCKQVISDFYKRRNSRNSIAEMVRLDDESLNDQIATDTEFNLDKYNVSGAIDKLTKEQREAFILIYVKHLKYKEAAEKMGRSESSVKSLAYRARHVLQEEITRENPEIGRRYGFTKAIKIALISAICLGLIGGFAYAMFRLYKAKDEKKTFTLSEVGQELPETETVISRDVACGKINEYLEIFGEEKIVSSNELHLNKDFYNFKECWNYSDDDCEIFIDSLSGKLVSFVCKNRDKLSQDKSYIEINDKLKLLDGYELYEDNMENDIRRIVYAKKYGEIFNLYESVTIIVRDDKVSSLFVKDYPYEDKEVIVSKEEAINILGLSESEVARIELAIEKLDINVANLNNRNFDGVNTVMDIELLRDYIDIRKVWKITTNNKMRYFINANNGEVYEDNTLDLF